MDVAQKFEKLPAGPAWDAFLAVPMTTVDEEAYASFKRDLAELIAEVRQITGWKDVRCRALELGDVDFNHPSKALDLAYGPVAACGIFLAILPASLPTSVMVEAGIALALKKPVVVACKDTKDLPFLLRGIDRAETPSYGRVLIYDEFSDIVSGIQKLIL